MSCRFVEHSLKAEWKQTFITHRYTFLLTWTCMLGHRAIFIFRTTSFQMTTYNEVDLISGVMSLLLHASLMLASYMCLQMTPMPRRMRTERALELRLFATLKPHVTRQWVLVLVTLVTLWTSEWYIGFWYHSSWWWHLLLQLCKWCRKSILEFVPYLDI
jgi:hypothetical protein